MVEHRVAGSWPGMTCTALGVDILGGSTDWHQFSGPLAFWCRGSERSPPDDILVRGRRDGVATWALGENPTSLP